MDEDHRDVVDAADSRAEADYRLAEIEVLDRGEVVGKRRADLEVLAWRRGARRFSGAKLQQSRDDGRNTKMFDGHGALPR
jgi:hypothetical protein